MLDKIESINTINTINIETDTIIITKKKKKRGKKYENNKDSKIFRDNPTRPLWAKGGSVKVNKKKQNIKKTYRTVTNRFSDRMLPGKKRTTRIY